MSEFYSILTEYGVEKVAAALMDGVPVNLATMVVGDEDRNPTGTETSLLHQVAEVQIRRVSINPSCPSEIIADAVIPGNVGGFWIREIGLKDEDGNLFALGRYPATYKPEVEEGAVKDVCVRMVLRVTNAERAIILYADGIIEWADLDLKNLSAAGQAKFDAKADLESPEFTGVPKAPTPDTEANDTRLATTAFVRSRLEALVNSAPGALDTLNELAEAIGSDPNFATTVANALAAKANIESPDLTGTPTAPTAPTATNNSQIATTAFARKAAREIASEIGAGIHDIVPVGTIIENMFPDVPEGYLPAWQPTVHYSRETYATLFQKLRDNGWITNASGDGSTTFLIPDFRGMFRRCTGGNAAAVGVSQAGAFASHTHVQDSHNHSQNSHNHSQNAHQHWVGGLRCGNNGAGGVSGGRNDGTLYGVATDGATASNNATTASNNAATAVNQSTGGVETRPVNFAVYLFIKY